MRFGHNLNIILYAGLIFTPIILISLGDTGIFVLGGKLRTDATKQYIFQSGDVIVMGGESQNFSHSFKGIIPNTSNLLKNAGG